MSNLVFTGTRKVEDVDFIKGALYFYNFDISQIKSIMVGCARGVDKAVRKFADEIGIEPDIYKADWKAQPKLGGLIRNQEMLEEAKNKYSIFDCDVIGLPCSESQGTISCLVIARHMGFRVHSYTWEFHKKYLERWEVESKRNFTYK